MKKYLLTLCLLALLLGGCGNQEKTKEDPVFSHFLSQEDLTSYVLKSKGQVSFLGSPKEDFTGLLERTKDPDLSHSIWEGLEEGKKVTVESYQVDKVLYSRENGKSWQKSSLEDEAQGKEKTSFVGQTILSPDKVLKNLKDYYRVQEEDGTYVASLESIPETLGEIQDILFGKGGKDPVLGNFTSFKAKFSFEKETYYPLSFAWEADFLSPDKKATTINQEGTYEKVNALEKIDLPPEVL